MESERGSARAVVAGIGESAYYERGKSPHSEFQLALTAIRAACADAGLPPAEIDGFVSYMPPEITATFYEDSLKFVGITVWLGYFWSECRRALDGGGATRQARA